MPRAQVLLADDDAGVLRILGALLLSFGADVEPGDGRRALKRLGERAFDLVISDVEMPGVKGPEVLEAASRLCPGATRVLMSGNAAALAECEAGGAPADFLLAKPVDGGRLREMVDDAVRSAGEIDGRVREFRRRYAASADAVFVKDTAGRYLFMNEVGAALLGRDVPEVEGRRDVEIFDGGTLSEEVRASDQAVLRTGRRFLYVNATRASGRAQIFLSAKLPIFESRRRVRAIGCLSRDVSALIEAPTADREGPLEALLRDLNEAAGLLAGPSGSETFAREEVERCLALSADESSRVGAAPRD